MAAVFRTGGRIAASYVCVCVCIWFSIFTAYSRTRSSTPEWTYILSITDLLEPVLPMADGSLPLPFPSLWLLDVNVLWRKGSTKYGGAPYMDVYMYTGTSVTQLFSAIPVL